MTPEQVELHEEAGMEFHVPSIVHRTGGPSASEVNICGVCGCYLTRSTGEHWDEIDEATADALRMKKETA